MGTVDKREDLDATIGPDGMQKNYLVLPEAERAKGFVRPVRRTYRHVGVRSPVNIRELSDEEKERYRDCGYSKFEEYPEDRRPMAGRYWTESDLARVGRGCGQSTTMGEALAETYARNPRFYGSTFCATCRTHFPVGEDGEFVWEGTNERVGT